MDDYITKPVRLEAIAEVLERWITRAPTGEAGGRGISERPGDVLPDPLESSQIDLLRSLDDGDGAVLGEIIGQYLLQTAEDRGELLRMVAEGDLSALVRTAHTLRGASPNVGASALAAVCAEMKAHGRGARPDEAAGFLMRFDAEFARVRAALDRVLTRT